MKGRSIYYLLLLLFYFFFLCFNTSCKKATQILKIESKLISFDLKYRYRYFLYKHNINRQKQVDKIFSYYCLNPDWRFDDKYVILLIKDDPNLLKKLIELLYDKKIRIKALFTIARLNGQSIKAVPDIKKILEIDKNQYVQIYCCYLLVKIKDDTPCLYKLINIFKESSDEKIKSEVLTYIALLGKEKIKDIKPLLLKYLKEGSIFEKKGIALSFLFIGDKQDLKVLKEIYKKEENPIVKQYLNETIQYLEHRKK